MLDQRQGPGRGTQARLAWSGAGDQQALFAEARRRRRRIRLTGAGLAVALAAAAISLGLGWPRHPSGSHAGSAPPAGETGTGDATTGPSLVWVDASDQVVIGNLATLTTRSVAQADTDPAAPLVPLAGHVYWVKFSGGYVDGADWPRIVESLSLATGRSTVVAPGEFAFPSVSGRVLYVSWSDTTLTELPAGRPGLLRQFPLPAGWYLPGGAGTALANGVAVQSDDAGTPAHPPVLGVWNPQTGRVRAIGRDVGVIGAYTPPGASHSLLAWLSARCRFPDCPIEITNTATLATRTLTSPLRLGFVIGGAFSPDGSQLAVFANASPQAGGQAAELAIADLATGAIRQVPGVRMIVGQDAAWVRWLPGGTSLVVQADRDYLVRAATGAARPFRFTGPSPDFSAQLIPGIR